jgi:hypothetical protein
MRQKIPALLISLLAAIYLANAINNALPRPPARLQYDRTVTLTGTLAREFDMAFVGDSYAPTQDATGAELAAAEALRNHPASGPVLRAPIPHLILRLDKPVTVQKGGGGSFPAERDVMEIDLGDLASGQFHIYGEALGNERYTVTGRLLHASTEHQLRAVTLEVADIRPAGG